MLGNRTKNFQLVPVHGALLYPLDFLMPPIKIGISSLQLLD